MACLRVAYNHKEDKKLDTHTLAGYNMYYKCS